MLERQTVQCGWVGGAKRAFLETGQNLAVQLAQDPRLLETSGEELKSIIGARMQAVPYFDQFIVLDAEIKVFWLFIRVCLRMASNSMQMKKRASCWLAMVC